MEIVGTGEVELILCPSGEKGNCKLHKNQQADVLIPHVLFAWIEVPLRDPFFWESDATSAPRQQRTAEAGPGPPALSAARAAPWLWIPGTVSH